MMFRFQTISRKTRRSERSTRIHRDQSFRTHWKKANCYYKQVY